MAGLRLSSKPLSSWSRTGPTGRLIVGAIIISLVGLSGLSPIQVFGMTLAWPHAALWGAVGWGLAGLSFRAMLVLAILGLFQDVSFNAPLGSFILVNLTTYGLAAAAQGSLDMERDPILGLLIPAASICAGFAVLWLLASTESDHPVRALPVIAALIMTLLLYYPLARLFHLRGRPGDRIRKQPG